ncbi:hypothetical protein DB44_CW00920 [Candidatus Protochlamydia amoebophila]|uniref:Uncharacterized protein n=2 Tax=Candidatus Protochlamydia amoebophila TaxID=362787 RepID=A0A0C1H2P3_9BACT|nr:hypothetical protein DB44_CW00920 [Candidatus Protochlamydia amoebophila]
MNSFGSQVSKGFRRRRKAKSDACGSAIKQLSPLRLYCLKKSGKLTSSKKSGRLSEKAF